VTAPAGLVIPAAGEDLGGLSEVIAAAHVELPVWRWVIPGFGERRRVLQTWGRLLLGWAASAGTVETTTARDAVAAWIPAGPQPPAPPPGYAGRLAAVTGRHAAGCHALEAAAAACYPAGGPREWLAVIAVSPGRQGQGTGTALLASRHHALDTDGRAACLAASPRVRGLCLRHGYADAGDPVRLPAGQELYPMLRTPGAGSQS